MFSLVSGIDECIDHNGHCQQFCTDTKTSYFCSCREGFEIDKVDPRVCQGMCLPNKSSSNNVSSALISR